ncbi:MAG: DoxX family membrane protein [Nanoarchaeota archaeon]
MKIKNPAKLSSFILRVALAVPFLYAAVSATLQPESWIGFMPLWLRSIFAQQLLLGAFSLYEFVLSLWLISGWKTRYAAGLAVITMASIIVVNIAALDIVFRDVGLLLAAVSLGVLHHKK